MIRNISTVEELDEYSEQDQEKDYEKFEKYIKSLSNPQLETLFAALINEYPNSELSYLLDSALDKDIKEELSELWTFRTQAGIER